MRSLVRTTRFTRGRLPHWEIEGGRYFVTVRCNDSLPPEVVARLREINQTLQEIEPASPQFAALQRRYFLTMEKYLEAGHGECLLRHESAAQALVESFSTADDGGAVIPHFSIMPNHWHAMIAPIADTTLDLHAFLSRLKGRAARAINQVLHRSGTLWQRDWFDRWMRDEAEWDRCVAYIRNNPVKAGIVEEWQRHPWTK